MQVLKYLLIIFKLSEMSTLPVNGLEIQNQDSDYLLGNLNGVFDKTVTNDSFLDTVWIRFFFFSLLNNVLLKEYSKRESNIRY